MRETIWVYVSQNERSQNRWERWSDAQEIDGRRKRERIKVLLDREIVWFDNEIGGKWDMYVFGGDLDLRRELRKTWN